MRLDDLLKVDARRIWTNDDVDVCCVTCIGRYATANLTDKGVFAQVAQYHATHCGNYIRQCVRKGWSQCPFCNRGNP